MTTRKLSNYAWLSIAAALVTMALKLGAWWLTGSVGLLSDALETLVNLAAALMALWMLRLAEQPADRQHAYGHDKAEYFASGFEGLLIFVAAGAIFWAAVPRLLEPQALDSSAIGMTAAALAAIINAAVARVLMRVGREEGSPTLRADAEHLMTDVWTSVGVIVGVALVMLTGWLWLDPVLALLVAINILRTGFLLIHEAAMGLMDSAWPQTQQLALDNVLDEFRQRGIEFHAIRTRGAARRHFVSMHVLVPGRWTVQQGHDVLEELEQVLDQRIPRLTVYTHMEPIEDPASHRDLELERHG